ncbi:T9SS type A sorting domain-containing protein [bacterium]|nr:T9SS type A sorting domain-containing protein [bacterium]
MKRIWMYLVVLLVPFLAVAQTWSQYTIVSSCFEPKQVQTADMDGDGDVDVISGGGMDDATITWWEKTVVGDDIVWVEHIVFTELFDVISVRCYDVDLDGDMDIAATSDYPTLMVTWFENLDGTGTSWDQWIITEGQREDNGRFVGMADIDGDGDNDAVISHWFWDHKLYWMENTDGLGHEWTQHMILQLASLPGRIRIADLDNDGDLDFPLINEGRFSWWENVNGDGSAWNQHQIDPTQQYNYFDGIEVVDMNGDTYLDIVYSITYDDEVRWWENDGTATIWTSHLITDFINYPGMIDVGDIDNDGDYDLAIPARLDGDLYWAQNLNSVGTLWQLQVVDTDLGYVVDVDISDIDADGTPDLVVTSGGQDGGLNWFGQSTDIQPIEFMLNPGHDVTIPSYGGTLEYDVHLTNNLDRPFYGATYWTRITLPNGNTTGPLFQQTFNLPAGASFHVSGLTQDIPGTAPAGDYMFHGYVGYFTDPNLGSSFAFMKHAGAADGPVVSEWTAGGKIVVPDLASAPDLPQEYALTYAWPNPFNAATSIEVTLPETADLSVTVYNTAGQQVATLANGSMSAGTHTLTFDASQLSSGLYFVQASVPGKLNQVRKVMLVR